MPKQSKEQEYIDEAARLALLPVADQRAIIALHQSVADDPKVSKANRREARERADALKRLLKLAPKKKRKQ